MKKQILSAVIFGMSLLPVAATAQHHHADNRHHQHRNATECPIQQAGEACSPDGCCSGAFEGITLTPEQQTKLKELRTNNDNQLKSRAKASKDARKANRAQADSVRRADRKNYLHSVKEILSPEQYVQFLENMAVNKPSGPVAREPRGGRHDMRREPAQRHDKAQKQSKAQKSTDAVVISGSAKKAEK